VTHASDIAIIGGGIVGLATAIALMDRYPRARLVILDKEPTIAAHQTGHNSGVIHSGLYYAPGSLKARLCRDGKQMLEEFAASHDLPIERCGKLVVALDRDESVRLEALAERGRANGVPGLEMLGPDGIRGREPHAAGIKGLWSPTTAITDFRLVAQAMAADIRKAGGMIETGREVLSIDVRPAEVVLQTSRGAIAARNLITCAGVQADRVAGMAGDGSVGRIVPFRGDYYLLAADARGLVNGLIYPVPVPRFPFLGVHFTKRIDGEVWAGPNAVLAFARNGYRRRDISLRDVAGTLSHRGFLGLARRHWSMGAGEMARDVSKRLFHRSLRRYLPELRLDQLVPGPSGVRAQLVLRDGTLVDDFVLGGSGRVLHVLNAPSPAATAALAIGEELAARAVERFELPVGRQH
jgi:L-2-hydroxyglutarate oxidase LhgO